MVTLSLWDKSRTFFNVNTNGLLRFGWLINEWMIPFTLKTVVLQTK
jgi:hypothetical protein